MPKTVERESVCLQYVVETVIPSLRRQRYRHLQKTGIWSFCEAILELIFVTISPKRIAGGPANELQEVYLQRSQRFAGVSAKSFRDEAALLESLEKSRLRTRPLLFLADSRGKLLTSEEFADGFRRAQADGSQQVVWAVGPADGWSPVALKRADLVVSFGRITLPHELAAVVATEQMYRALTILAGHPYHSGH